MDIEEINAERIDLLLSIVQSGLTSIAIIFGGFWAYFRFIRQRENNALIDFSVDIVFHSFLDDYWLVEIVAFVENKGKVQHKIYKFDFKLEYLEKTDRVISTSKEEEERGQVKFKILEEGSFMRRKRLKRKSLTIFHNRIFTPCISIPKKRYFFIEPGLKNKYSYVTKVPSNTDILLLHSWFEYPNSKHGHIAEVTKKVPELK